MGFVDEKNFNQAISDSTVALRHDPYNKTAFLARGLAYLGMRDFERAIADLTPAVRLDWQNRATWNARGVAYLNSKKYREAFDDFNNAIRRDANDAELYFNRGTAIFEGSIGGLFATAEDVRASAIADFTKSLELDPTLGKGAQ